MGEYIFLTLSRFTDVASKFGVRFQKSRDEDEPMFYLQLARQSHWAKSFFRGQSYEFGPCI